MRASIIILGSAGVLLSSTVASLSGCTGFTSTPVADAGAALSFSELQAQVFAKNCAFAGCHPSSNPAASLPLAGAAACSNLVGTTSCLFPSKLRVSPGEPDKSFLIDKLQGTHLDGVPQSSCAITNQRMPVGGAALSQDQINLVVNWIAAGANCGSATDGGVDTGNDGGVETGTDGGIVDGPEAPAQSLVLGTGTLVAGSELPLQLTLAEPAPAQGQMVGVQASDLSTIAVPSYVFVAGGRPR
jgi:hypothetical protein